MIEVPVAGEVIVHADNVRRADGKQHGKGFSGPLVWQGRLALQVSRRSNRWSPALDTAAAKLLKVLEWVRSQ